MRAAPIIIATVSAPIIPAVLFAAFEVFGGVPIPWILVSLVVAYVAAIIHIVVLGIPTIFALRRIRFLNWFSILCSGFVLGMVGYAILTWLTWPVGSNWSSQQNGEWEVIDGHIRAVGWYRHVIGAVETGLAGVLTSAAFYAILRTGRRLTVR